MPVQVQQWMEGVLCMDSEPFYINLDGLGKQTGQFQVQMVQITT